MTPSTAANAKNYFEQRAPRYAAALRGCPLARLLDLLPYLASMGLISDRSNQPREACDAFGGTGFLARWLGREHLRFTVVDCCNSMLDAADGLQRYSTHNDFADFAEATGRPTFSMVTCHGGLHHVVQLGPDGIPDPTASRQRQTAIARRLASLVHPGGVLVIADIPDRPSSGSHGAVSEQRLDASLVHRLLGRDARDLLCEILPDKFGDGMVLQELARHIEASIATPVDFEVPRHFFDEYVARSTPHGHIAVYPDFDELTLAASECGLKPAGSVNFRGPLANSNTPITKSARFFCL